MNNESIKYNITNTTYNYSKSITSSPIITHLLTYTISPSPTLSSTLSSLLSESICISLL